VSRNDGLLDFWYHGNAWTQPEVNDFCIVDDGSDTTTAKLP
jgi:hypothetical protein